MEQFLNAHDVVICGGGLAGLTLARQLRIRNPEMDITVLERDPEPYPEAAHKVGESSVELGAHYFTTYLELAEYLHEHQLPKFGLRYFFGTATDNLAERLEFGPQQFPPVPSLQLDRGRLENDLRKMNRDLGVTIRTGAAVQHIELSAGTHPHEIHFGSGGSKEVLRTRWVVDASGRRRLIQSRLGLSTPSGHEASSAWWRIAGIKKINGMLGARGRIPWDSRLQDKRWLSTNHIMGRGYWIWFIPLSSGNTSIGIVTDENIHPLNTYNSFERAMRWLETHEPAVANYIRTDEPLDFKALKRYSYWSKQIFSKQRWTCVGEAGIFADPFYSPGSDYIALGNTFTTALIEADFRGEDTTAMVEQFNQTILKDIGNPTISYYRGVYEVFGAPKVMVAKIHWDTCYYWGFPCQMFFQRHLQPDHLREYGELAARFIPLNARVQTLFRDWSRTSKNTQLEGGRFVPYSSMPFFRRLLAELQVRKEPSKMFSDMRENLHRLEEWAQVLFRIAYQDVSGCSLPPRLEGCEWLNSLGIGLDPSRWDEDGLFEPTAPPRSLEDMTTQTMMHVFSPVESRG